ncbi:MAG: hypothetical protein H6R15_1571 [Proteobacteria bacterium]|nr:hypothetical protein [Pseudomonadota bacterium]
MNARLLRRHLSYRLHRLGWPGTAGFALLLAALTYGLVVFPATARRADQLAQQLAAARGQLQRTAGQPANGQPASPDEQLRAFYQAFPKGATVPDWLGEIYSLAGQQQLALEAGEYTLTRAPSGRLDRFRIAFPVKGSYPQIRRFIAAALATAPALSLDGIYLKRDKVGDGTVDARIVFLLYLEKGA